MLEGLQQRKDILTILNHKIAQLMKEEKLEAKIYECEEF